MIPDKDVNRLVFHVELEPIVGKTFQPTGFPDLGSAEIHTHDKGISLLVESQQSMANRLESVCLTPDGKDFVDELKGLSMVSVVDQNGEHLTNSVLEAHRVASHYIISKNSEIKTKLEELESSYKGGIDIKATADILYTIDLNSLIHGLWASQIGSGRIKISRALSSFIEADNAQRVISGGAKIDHVNPSTDEEAGGAKEGQGNIPFTRVEYTAKSINAYFNLDLQQIRSYGLDPTQEDLLITLALWKIRRFLEGGLRLRTACDMKIKGGVKTITPEGYNLPDMDSLDDAIKDIISKDDTPKECHTVKYNFTGKK